MRTSTTISLEAQTACAPYCMLLRFVAHVHFTPRRLRSDHEKSQGADADTVSLPRPWSKPGHARTPVCTPGHPQKPQKLLPAIFEPPREACVGDKALGDGVPAQIQRGGLLILVGIHIIWHSSCAMQYIGMPERALCAHTRRMPAHKCKHLMRKRAPELHDPVIHVFT